MKLSKLFLPVMVTVVILIIYFTYIAPTSEIGSFEIYSSGSEINQEINVRVNKVKGFERDANGKVVAFYATDKNNIEMRVYGNEPINEAEIANAEVVEVLGHAHGNSLHAAKITVVK